LPSASASASRSDSGCASASASGWPSASASGWGRRTCRRCPTQLLLPLRRQTAPRRLSGEWPTPGDRPRPKSADVRYVLTSSHPLRGRRSTAAPPVCWNVDEPPITLSNCDPDHNVLPSRSVTSPLCLRHTDLGDTSGNNLVQLEYPRLHASRIPRQCPAESSYNSPDRAHRHRPRPWTPARATSYSQGLYGGTVSGRAA
jgi:hypothetical protein